MLIGKDLLAQADTGSGKTAAFAIALLSRLEPTRYNTQALVLCPTRELAEQVSNETRRLARAIPNTKIMTLCGGKPLQPQLVSLSHHPHIVIGTPGRILKHLSKGSLKLDILQTLVLDEADRMLDMGFYEDIINIINFTPRSRQTLLFSATYPEEIEQISHSIQQSPVDVRVTSQTNKPNIKQLFYEINKGERAKVLSDILKHYKPESCIIFCNRKQQCNELAEDLRQQGFHAQALHGDLEQKDRDRVFVQFANKSSSILIATDVAARGLDIKELPLVINYELAHDPEIHVHRIGRTGRAGQEGLALSLYMASEAKKVNAIEEYQDGAVKVTRPSSLSPAKNFKLTPPMRTLLINAGRKNKIRPGDILGGLTSTGQIPGKQIGKINIFDTIAYVAIERPLAKQAIKILNEEKIKGRRLKARLIA